MTRHADTGAFGRSMSVAEFRSNIGEAMDLVQREPVTITETARPEAGPRVSHAELLRDLGLEV